MHKYSISSQGKLEKNLEQIPYQKLLYHGLV